LHQLIQVKNELAAFICLTHESSSLYSFQGSRDAATIVVRVERNVELGDRGSFPQS
jgi:hypothetical protein